VRIVVAGGSGFLGRPLVRQLTSAGHTVVTLSRGENGVSWQPDGTAHGAWAREIDGADAIVNLAGENLAGGRWTARRKRALRDSRLLSTRSLVAAVRAATRKPEVFLSASAVGYYGDTGDRTVDESSPAGSDFLATLCAAWEEEARAAEALGCRVVIVRGGVVLDRRGGALEKMIPPFLFFVGGPMGTGRQAISWIHVDDWLALVQWALETKDVSGPLNGTAPAPVTSREFARALGRALHRPSWFPVPALILRLVVGELADVALLAGQRALPARALQGGFVFRYPAIDKAMSDAVRRK
jgi:uncharacterized protein (TIGR01777 family)